MTLSTASFRSPLAKKVYIIFGIIAVVMVCLYIFLRVFVAHAQSVANKNMNYPCPKYLMNQRPVLTVGSNDSNRPDKCVHYFQTLLNISALDQAKKENSKVVALVPIDGFYSPAEGNAVLIFQKNHSIKATGKVDTKTWHELETIASNAK